MSTEIQEKSGVLIGTVRHLQGVVSVKRAGQSAWIKLQNGDQLFEGDRLDQASGMVVALQSPQGRFLTQKEIAELATPGEPVIESDESSTPLPHDDNSTDALFDKTLEESQKIWEQDEQDVQKNIRKIVEQVAAPQSNTSATGLGNTGFSSPESLPSIFGFQDAFSVQDFSGKNFQAQTHILTNDQSFTAPTYEQDNVNQNVTTKFATNNHSAILLDNYLLSVLPQNSAYTTMIAGNLVVNFDDFLDLQLPESSDRNQNLLHFIFNAAPRSDSELESYRMVMTFPQAYQSLPDNMKIMPLVSSAGWLSADSLTEALQWEAVDPNSGGASSVWSLTLPKELFGASVSFDDVALIESTLRDLAIFDESFGELDRSASFEEFTDHLESLTSLNYERPEIARAIVERLKALLYTSTVLSDGSVSEMSLKAGLSPRAAYLVTDSLLEEQTEQLRSMLFVRDTHPRIGRMFIAVAPEAPLPENSTVDFQLKTGLHQEFYSILETPEPLTFATAPAVTPTTDLVRLVEAYHSFAKEFIEEGVSPIAGILRNINSQETAALSPPYLPQQEPLRWHQQWVINPQSLYNKASADLAVHLSDPYERTATMTATIEPVSTIQDLTAELQSAYTDFSAQMRRSDSSLKARDVSIAIQKPLALYYQYSSDAAIGNELVGFRASQSAAQTPIPAQSSILDTPIGSDNFNLLEITYNGRPITHRIEGQKFLSLSSLQLISSGNAATLDVTYLNPNTGLETTSSVALTAEQISDPALFVAAMNSALRYSGMGNFFQPLAADLKYRSAVEGRVYSPSFEAMSRQETTQSLQSYLDYVAELRGLPQASVVATDLGDAYEIQSSYALEGFLYFQSESRSMGLSAEAARNSTVRYSESSTNTGGQISKLTVGSAQVLEKLYYSQSTQISGTPAQADIDLAQQALEAAFTHPEYPTQYRLNGAKILTPEIWSQTLTLIDTASKGSGSAGQSYEISLHTFDPIDDQDYYQADGQVYTFTTAGFDAIGGWALKGISDKLHVYAVQTITTDGNESVIVDGYAVTFSPSLSVAHPDYTITDLGGDQYQIAKAGHSNQGLESLNISIDGVLQDSSSEIKVESVPIDVDASRLEAALDALTVELLSPNKVARSTLDALEIRLQVSAIDRQSPAYDRTMPLYIDTTLTQNLPALPVPAATSDSVSDGTLQEDLAPDAGTTPELILGAEGVFWQPPTLNGTWRAGHNTVADPTGGVMLRHNADYALESSTNELADMLTALGQTTLAAGVTKAINRSEGLIIFRSDEPLHESLALLNSAGQSRPLSSGNNLLYRSHQSTGQDAPVYELTGTPASLRDLLVKSTTAITSGADYRDLLDYSSTNFDYSLDDAAHTSYEVYPISDHRLLLPVTSSQDRSYYASELDGALALEKIDALSNPLFDLSLNYLPWFFVLSGHSALPNLTLTVNDASWADTAYYWRTPTTALIPSDFETAYNNIVGMATPSVPQLYADIQEFTRLTQRVSHHNPADTQAYLNLFEKLVDYYNDNNGSDTDIDAAALIAAAQYHIITRPDANISSGDRLIVFLSNQGFQPSFLVGNTAFSTDTSVDELGDLLSHFAPTAQQLSFTKTVNDTETDNSGQIILQSDQDFEDLFLFIDSSHGVPRKLSDVMTYAKVADDDWRAVGSRAQWAQVFYNAPFDIDGAADTILNATGQAASLTTDGTTLTHTYPEGVGQGEYRYRVAHRGHIYEPESSSATDVGFDVSPLEQTRLQHLTVDPLVQPLPALVSLERDTDSIPFDFDIPGFSLESTSYLPIKIVPKSTTLNFEKGDLIINGVSIPAFSLDASSSSTSAQSVATTVIATALAAEGLSLGSDPTFAVRLFVDEQEPSQRYLTLSSGLGLPIVTKWSAGAQQLLGMRSDHLNVSVRAHYDAEHNTEIFEPTYVSAVRQGASFDPISWIDTDPLYPSVADTSLPFSDVHDIWMHLMMLQAEPTDNIPTALAFLRLIDPQAQYLGYDSGTTTATFGLSNPALASAVSLQMQTTNSDTSAASIEGSVLTLDVAQYTAGDARLSFDVAALMAQIGTDDLAAAEEGVLRAVLKLPYLQNLSDWRLFSYDGSSYTEMSNTIFAYEELNLDYFDTPDESYVLSLTETADYQSKSAFQSAAELGFDEASTFATLRDGFNPYFQKIYPTQDLDVRWSLAAGTAISTGMLIADAGTTQLTELLTETTAPTYQFAGSIRPDIMLLAAGVDAGGQWFYTDGETPSAPEVIVRAGTATEAALQAVFGSDHITISGQNITVKNPSASVQYQGETLSTGTQTGYSYNNGFLRFSSSVLENFNRTISGTLSTESGSYVVSWTELGTEYRLLSAMPEAATTQFFAPDADAFPSALGWEMTLTDATAYTQASPRVYDGTQTVAFEFNTGTSDDPNYQQYFLMPDQRVLDIGGRLGARTVIEHADNHAFSVTPLQADISLMLQTAGSWLYRTEGFLGIDGRAAIVTFAPQSSLVASDKTTEIAAIFGAASATFTDTDTNFIDLIYNNARNTLSHVTISGAPAFHNTSHALTITGSATASIIADSTTIAGGYSFAPGKTTNVLLVPETDPSPWAYATNWATLAAQGNSADLHWYYPESDWATLVDDGNASNDYIAALNNFWGFSLSDGDIEEDPAGFTDFLDAVDTDAYVKTASGGYWVSYSSGSVPSSMPILYINEQAITDADGILPQVFSSPPRDVDGADFTVAGHNPDHILESSQTGRGVWFFDTARSSRSWQTMISEATETITATALITPSSSISISTAQNKADFIIELFSAGLPATTTVDGSTYTVTTVDHPIASVKVTEGGGEILLKSLLDQALSLMLQLSPPHKSNKLSAIAMVCRLTFSALD